MIYLIAQEISRRANSFPWQGVKIAIIKIVIDRRGRGGTEVDFRSRGSIRDGSGRVLWKHFIFLARKFVETRLGILFDLFSGRK